MSDYEHPPVESLGVTAVLFALSDPARLAIVRQVASPLDEVTCQLVAQDMPKSTRSHHLKVLREAGIVNMAVRGREKVLTLRRDDLDSRWPGLLSAVLEEHTFLGEVVGGGSVESSDEGADHPGLPVGMAGSLRSS